MKIGIIGGGAAGMMAALAASRTNNSEVTILEHKEILGKKINATGNGKCNFTNQYMNSSCYRGDLELLESAFQAFSNDQLLSFFSELGIFPKNKNGYYYPYSENASSVRKAFELALKQANVEVCTSVSILEIGKNNSFYVKCKHGDYEFDKLIIATGLLASPALGSDGTAFPLIKSFGHSFTSIHPALVGFEASGFNFEAVAGLRSEGKLSLFVENELIMSENGEIQFTEYGVSGIPVFQASGFAVRALEEEKAVHITFDFFPQITEEDLFQLLLERKKNMPMDRKFGDYFNGLLHQKLANAVLSLFYISQKTKLSDVTEQMLRDIAKVLKAVDMKLISPRGFDNAQVCAGGIKTKEVDVNTLESKLVAGLYFAGEILNIDGKCGGYNLRWAFSSGYLAGCHAALALK